MQQWTNTSNSIHPYVVIPPWQINKVNTYVYEFEKTYSLSLKKTINDLLFDWKMLKMTFLCINQSFHEINDVFNINILRVRVFQTNSFCCKPQKWDCVHLYMNDRWYEHSQCTNRHKRWCCFWMFVHFKYML